MAANWDVDQVCQWLEREGFGQYDVKFRSNAVDGATLLDISANDLKVELEIPILRDRKALLAAIETLKDGQTASAPSVPAAMSSSSHGISSHSSTEYTSSNALPPYNGSSHTTTITTSTAYTTPGYTPSPRTMQQTSTGATVSPRRFKFDDFDKEYHMKKTQQEININNHTARPSTGSTGSRVALDAAKSSYCDRTKGYGKIDYGSLLNEQKQDEANLAAGQQKYQQILRQSGF